MTLAEQHTPDWILEFDRLSGHVQAALDRGGNTHTVQDVAAGLESGQFQMWTGDDSIIITEIVDFPRKRICNYFLAGGRLNELEPMVPVIEEWAKEERGCDGITLIGREGWSKTFLRDMGYTVLHCEMSKEF
jgi:hypothetical protein